MTHETPLDGLVGNYVPPPVPDIIAEVARLGTHPTPQKLSRLVKCFRRLGWSRDHGQRVAAPEGVKARLRAHPEWEASGLDIQPAGMLMAVRLAQIYVWAWERKLL